MRPEPWSVDDAPEKYIRGQAKGIVGLELALTHLDAKRKLTQNRSRDDITGAIGGLSSGSAREQAVADDMREAAGRD
jgi:transcriptional regulator